MPNNKSTFESRDLTSGLSLVVEKNEDSTEEPKYTGKERRKENRREASDRREEVRFEIKKTDRRENHGRRSDDNSPTFW